MAGCPPPSISLPSDLNLLPVVRTFVEQLCKAAAMDARVTEAMVLVTNEAVSNVIRHAHQGKLEARLRVDCMVSSQGVEVCIHDQGAPFHVDDVPRMNPCEMRIGGRGVFLMRAMLDELECTPQPDGGNVLRMVKRCAASAPRGCGKPSLNT